MNYSELRRYLLEDIDARFARYKADNEPLARVEVKEKLHLIGWLNKLKKENKNGK